MECSRGEDHFHIKLGIDEVYEREGKQQLILVVRTRATASMMSAQKTFGEGAQVQFALEGPRNPIPSICTI